MMKRAFTILALALATGCATPQISGVSGTEKLVDTIGVADPGAFGPEIERRMLAALTEERRLELGLLRESELPETPPEKCPPPPDASETPGEGGKLRPTIGLDVGFGGVLKRKENARAAEPGRGPAVAGRDPAPAPTRKPGVTSGFGVTFSVEPEPAEPDPDCLDQTRAVGIVETAAPTIVPPGPGMDPLGPMIAPPPSGAGGAPTQVAFRPSGQAAAPLPAFVCGDPASEPHAHGCAFYAVIFTDRTDEDRQFCSGVIISPRHVLTARHCFERRVDPAAGAPPTHPLTEGRVDDLYQAQTMRGYVIQARDTAFDWRALAARSGRIDLTDARFRLYPERDLALVELPEGRLRDGAYAAAELVRDAAPRWIAPIGVPDWAALAALLPTENQPVSDDVWTRTAFSVFGVTNRKGYYEKAYGRTTLTRVDPETVLVQHKDLGLCDGDSGAGMYRRLTTPWAEHARHAVVGVVSGAGQVTLCDEDAGYDARSIVRLDGEALTWIEAELGVGAAPVVSEEAGTLLPEDPRGVMTAAIE